MGVVKAFYVIGDSFSFGQELGGSDVAPKDFFVHTDYMREHSFTGVIAKQWGVEHIINHSLPGASNDRTFRMIIEELPKMLTTFRPEEIFVFINITHSSRREFYESEHKRWWNLIANHQPEHHEKYATEFWKLYTTYFNHPEESCRRLVSQVIGIQSFINSLGIQYLMTDSMYHDNDFWDVYKTIDLSILNRIDHIRYNREEPFNGFVGRKKLPFGKYNHPLEEGHRAWAHHLMGYLHNKGITPN